MTQEEQKFLSILEKILWETIEELYLDLDPIRYKHIVFDLLFLKYISHAFEQRRKQLHKEMTTPGHENYFDPENFDPEEYRKVIETELEEPDNYLETNTFLIPKNMHWKGLLDTVKHPDNLRKHPVAWWIAHTLDAIKQENPKQNGIPDREVIEVEPEINDKWLIQLMELIDNNTPTEYKTLQARDIFSHLYKALLDRFAISLEGIKGGDYRTPSWIVRLMVAMLKPLKGKIYDPAMGPGGFFALTHELIKECEGESSDVFVYGQEWNSSVRQLAAMNMVIRGMEFNFGKAPQNSFSHDQHPDLKADYAMCNPPIKQSENFGMEESDPRWVYGVPSKSGAGFGWVQQMLYHLTPNGSMAVLLPKGSTFSADERKIRQALIENDLVECIVTLPGQTLINTQIPFCIWFLSKNRSAEGVKKSCKNRVLFINAQEFGFMKDRFMRELEEEEIQKIIDTFHNWQEEKNYNDEEGFCRSVTVEEIKQNEFKLTPNDYTDTPRNR